MEVKINDIINRHKGERCIVIGHGPSLNLHSEKLCNHREAGFVLIGCNNWHEFHLNCPPDYWVNANNVDNNNITIISLYEVSNFIETTPRQFQFFQ